MSLLPIAKCSPTIKAPQTNHSRNYTPTEEPAKLESFDNDREAKTIVQRVGDPAMLLRDVAEVNTAMVIRYGVIAGIVRRADEFKCLARSEVFISITPAINPSG